MTVVHAPNVTDKFATRFVRRIALKLVSDETYPASDLEDAIQDLTMALVEQVGNFDPDKARWSTFVKQVVITSAISLRRYRQAQMRQSPSELTSLSTKTLDEDGAPTELGNLVDEEEYRAGRGEVFVSHTVRIELAQDVEAFTRRLPAELQELCRRIKAQQELQDIAPAMGMTRRTLQLRIKELQAHFLAAGFAPPGRC